MSHDRTISLPLQSHASDIGHSRLHGPWTFMVMCGDYELMILWTLRGAQAKRAASNRTGMRSLDNR